MEQSGKISKLYATFYGKRVCISNLKFSNVSYSKNAKDYLLDARLFYNPLGLWHSVSQLFVPADRCGRTQLMKRKGCFDSVLETVHARLVMSLPVCNEAVHHGGDMWKKVPSR